MFYYGVPWMIGPWHAVSGFAWGFVVVGYGAYLWSPSREASCEDSQTFLQCIPSAIAILPHGVWGVFRAEIWRIDTAHDKSSAS